MLPNGVGYIDLKAFSDSTEREVTRSVKALRSRGAKSLILDLRSNPGGILEQGSAVADLFLGPGQKIVSLRGRVPEVNRDFTDSTRRRGRDFPLRFSSMRRARAQQRSSQALCRITTGH